MTTIAVISYGVMLLLAIIARQALQVKHNRRGKLLTLTLLLLVSYGCNGVTAYDDYDPIQLKLSSYAVIQGPAYYDPAYYDPDIYGDLCSVTTQGQLWHVNLLDDCIQDNTVWLIFYFVSLPNGDYMLLDIYQPD